MKFRTKKRKSIALDVTPLIDVIFLLLLFFMLTSSFIKKTSLDVNLPKSKYGNKITKEKTLELEIRASGKIFIEKKYVQGWKLKSIFQKYAGKQTSLLISADENVRHKRIIFVMDQAKAAKIESISISALEK